MSDTESNQSNESNKDQLSIPIEKEVYIPRDLTEAEIQSIRDRIQKKHSLGFLKLRRTTLAQTQSKQKLNIDTLTKRKSVFEVCSPSKLAQFMDSKQLSQRSVSLTPQKSVQKISTIPVRVEKIAPPNLVLEQFQGIPSRYLNSIMFGLQQNAGYQIEDSEERKIYYDCLAQFTKLTQPSPLSGTENTITRPNLRPYLSTYDGRFINTNFQTKRAPLPPLKKNLSPIRQLVDQYSRDRSPEFNIKQDGGTIAIVENDIEYSIGTGKSQIQNQTFQIDSNMDNAFKDFTKTTFTNQTSVQKLPLTIERSPQAQKTNLTLERYIDINKFPEILTKINKNLQNKKYRIIHNKKALKMINLKLNKNQVAKKTHLHQELASVDDNLKALNRTVTKINQKE